MPTLATPPSIYSSTEPYRAYGPEQVPDSLVVQALDAYGLLRDRALTGPQSSQGALVETNRLRDASGLRRFAGQALDAVVDALTGAPDQADELVPMIARLRRLETSLDSYQQAVTVELHGRIDEAVARLGRCRSSEALIAGIPRYAADLGFDRVLFSAVSGSAWRPHALYTGRDSRWSEAYLNHARNEVLTLPPAAVANRPAYVTTSDMLKRPAREAGFSLWRRSRAQDFWMVPVVHRTRLLGIVHADCLNQDRSPTRIEVECLTEYCRRTAPLLAAYRTVTGRPVGVDPAEGSGEGFVDEPDGAAPLSQRELEVVRLMAEGLTNAQVGRRLSITEGTVKSHVKRILRKTGSANRAEAVAWLHTQRLQTR